MHQTQGQKVFRNKKTKRTVNNVPTHNRAQFKGLPRQCLCVHVTCAPWCETAHMHTAALFLLHDLLQQHVARVSLKEIGCGSLWSCQW